MSKSRTFEELSAELQAARTAATQRINGERARVAADVAALGGGEVRWEPAAFEKALAADTAEAQAAFDASVLANEKAYISWALRELTALAREFRKSGDREAAVAFMSKLRQVGGEKLKYTGRTLGEYGVPNEAWLAFAQTFVTDNPPAMAPFANVSALSALGTPEAVDRVMRVVANRAATGAEAIAALELLERCCSRIAASAPGAVIIDEIRARWDLCRSGKSHAAREQVLRDLAAARQRADIADWEATRDRARRIRAGDASASEGMTGDEVSSIMRLGAAVFGAIAPGVRAANPWRKGAE